MKVLRLLGIKPEACKLSYHFSAHVQMELRAQDPRDGDLKRCQFCDSENVGFSMKKMFRSILPTARKYTLEEVRFHIMKAHPPVTKV